ncbi:MAG: DUF1430 domain-containing protein [Eubacteriales bacterium]|nr:DUF1430 domain-containing protein [Eubacteriales bacterium]
MKKYLAFFLLFLSLSFIVFSAYFFANESSYLVDFTSSGEKVGKDFVSYSIFFSDNKRTAQQSYDDLERVLHEYGANLYIDRVSAEDGTYIKYVYCEHPELFEDLRLEWGRFFTNQENRSELFLSTEATGKEKQIGQISSFRKSNKFEIRTLHSGLDIVGFFDGSLTLILPAEIPFSTFQDIMSDLGYKVIGSSTLGSPEIRTTSNAYYFGGITLAIGISILITLLAVFFYVINSYRKIGIKKMLGYSVKDLWHERMLPIFLTELFCFVIVPFVAYFLLFGQDSRAIRDFYLGLGKIYAGIMLLSLVVLSLPFIYANRVKVADVLKNRRSTTLAIGFNTGIKVLLSILLVIFSFNVITQASQISSRYSSSLRNWEASKPYAIIRGAASKSRDFNVYSKENTPYFKEAYRDFNRDGAIYADFEDYSPTTHELLPPDFPAYRMSAMVNPNYLKEHPAYDLDNKVVTIAEDEVDSVVLIPEKYKEHEQDILAWREKNALAGQKVRLIWLQNNQSFFTYRLDIAPQTGNCVLDPILIVVSENNTLDGMYGNLASRSLLIKTQNPAEPGIEVNEVLGKYFPSDKVRFITYGVYDLVNSQIQKARQTILFYAVILLILFITMCSVIMQNISNYFNQHKQRLAVQHFLGFTHLDKYKVLLGLTLLSFPIVYVISALILHDWSVIWLVAIILFVELFTAGIFIARNERKNIIKVIKGGA